MKRIKRIYKNVTSNVITITKDDMTKLKVKTGDYIEIDMRKQNE